MGVASTAFLLSVAAASTTMLGWVAVAAKRTWTSRQIGLGLLVSAVAMLLISLVELLPPGLRDPDTRVAAALLFVLGAVLVPVLGRLLDRLTPSVNPLQSASVLVMVSIAVHNVPEGTLVFAATMVSVQTGLVTAAAIALHNIPEGMAVATAVIASGGNRRRALVFTAVSMFGEMLGALVMLLVGAALSPAAATMLLSLVGGIMVSLSVTQLIPSGLTLARTGTTTSPAVPIAATGPTGSADNGRLVR